MFVINDDKSIYLTRGDIATIKVSAKDGKGSDYLFKVGDVVRFKAFERKDCGCVVLQKDTTIEEETSVAQISLDKQETKIGELISKPKDYWYEIELNPEKAPQTIIGYDEDGAKIFRLYPEGSDVNE